MYTRHIVQLLCTLKTSKKKALKAVIKRRQWNFQIFIGQLEEKLTNNCTKCYILLNFCVICNNIFQITLLDFTTKTQYARIFQSFYWGRIESRDGKFSCSLLTHFVYNLYITVNFYYHNHLHTFFN